MKKVVAAKLGEDDLVSLNRIMDSLGYKTLGELLRDIARHKVTLGNYDVLQRLTSIEEKVSLLYFGREPSKPATRVQIPPTALSLSKLILLELRVFVDYEDGQR